MALPPEGTKEAVIWFKRLPENWRKHELGKLRSKRQVGELQDV